MAKTKSKKKSSSKGSKHNGSKNSLSGSQTIDQLLAEVFAAIASGADGRAILKPLVDRWEELKATAHLGDLSYVRLIDAKIKQLELILNTGGPFLRGLAGQAALPAALPQGGVAVAAPGLEYDVKFQPQELEELRRFEQRCHEHGGGQRISPFDTYPQPGAQAGHPGHPGHPGHGQGYQPTFQNPSDPRGGAPPQQYPSAPLPHHGGPHHPAHALPGQAFQPTFQNPADRPPTDVAAPMHPQYPSQHPHPQHPPHPQQILPPQHVNSQSLPHIQPGAVIPPLNQSHPSQPPNICHPPPSTGYGSGLEPPTPVPPPSNGYFHQQGMQLPPGGFY